MRTSVVAAVAGILVLAAAGGYYGLEVFPQQQFRAGLDQTLATLPPGTTATYRDAHYSPLSHLAVVTGLTVHAVTTGQSPQQIDTTIDTIETTNPNLDFSGSWNKFLANKAALTRDTVLPVADSIIIKGVTVHAATINGTLDSVRIDRLRLYPWALLHDGMPTWKEIQTSLVPRSEPPTLADVQPVLRFEAAVMLGVAYDGYDAGHMKISTSVPGVDVAYEINRMTGDHCDRGVFKGGTAEGVTITGAKIGTVALDHATVGAIDLRDPMTRIVDGEPLSAALLNRITIGRIEYVGIAVQPPGQPSFHAGRFSLGPVAFAQGMPVSGALAWQDISVSRSQLPETKVRDGFTRLGLETITTSFAVSYDWDVAQQRASLHDTVLKVNELGTIALSAELANVVANATALNEARLVRARLRFDDASLVERLLRMGAEQTGTDPAAYRQQIADLVRQQSATTGGDSPLLTAAGKAVADFVASPHSLTIELSPPTPVPFFALKGATAVPAELAAMLGLTVSANQP